MDDFNSLYKKLDNKINFYSVEWSELLIPDYNFLRNVKNTIGELSFKEVVKNIQTPNYKPLRYIEKLLNNGKKAKEVLTTDSIELKEQINDYRKKELEIIEELPQIYNSNKRKEKVNEIKNDTDKITSDLIKYSKDLREELTKKDEKYEKFDYTFARFHYNISAQKNDIMKVIDGILIMEDAPEPVSEKTEKYIF